MSWGHEVAYFFGGTMAANAIPHTVAGIMGRRFPTPFAKPPGRGLSSSLVNVCWGFGNLVAAYLLLARVGEFDPRSGWDAGAAGLGALLIAVQLAWHFGRLKGGNGPEST